MSDQEETASIGCDVLDGKERDKNDATKSRDALVDIRQLKQDRTSAKRALTKKHNEIKQLIQNPNNASEISQKMLHLETAIENLVMPISYCIKIYTTRMIYRNQTTILIVKWIV
jgi:hypothetical protein